MTLTEMHAGDMGVILAMPPMLSYLPFASGARVRFITTEGGATLIEASGMRFALSLAVARQMILAAYIE